MHFILNVIMLYTMHFKLNVIMQSTMQFTLNATQSELKTVLSNYQINFQMSNSLTKSLDCAIHKKKNRFFATNSDFLIPISLQSNVVDYFKL